MLDITNIEQNVKTYGGTSCLKLGVTVDGERYLVKYSNDTHSAVCEFLGSQIFKILGMEPHCTRLAVRSGKLVILCKDFVPENVRLVDFSELKFTYEKAFVSKSIKTFEASGSDLADTLLVIRNHPIAKQLYFMEERFWKMFIIDAFIGNVNRDNTNWGFLVQNDKLLGYAPVYDNGECLSDKLNYYRFQNCFFTVKGKRANPFDVMVSQMCPKCSAALASVLKRDFNQVYNLIESFPLLNDLQRKSLLTVLKKRELKLRELHKSISGRF